MARAGEEDKSDKQEDLSESHLVMGAGTGEVVLQ